MDQQVVNSKVSLSGPYPGDGNDDQDGGVVLGDLGWVLGFGCRVGGSGVRVWVIGFRV